MKKKSVAHELYQLVMDFFKKCNDDHVPAFGAMSAFFMILSTFPFMIFFLTLTRFAPFTKDDVIYLLVNTLSFERESLIVSIVNEVYAKTGTSVFTLSILAALWSSSKGVYSIIKGLDSVYDLEDNRNYILLRILSTFYTIIFAFMILAVLILWVFGNVLYKYIQVRLPVLASVASYFIHERILMTILVLTVGFMIIYTFIPDRKSRFLKQWPGALVAAVGWIVISFGCSLLMEGFSSFSYVYGSMAGIMILLLWLYYCMSMIFYGAEFNYFLENKENYHDLVWAFRHNLRASQRMREKLRKSSLKLKTKDRTKKACQVSDCTVTFEKIKPEETGDGSLSPAEETD